MAGKCCQIPVVILRIKGVYSKPMQLKYKPAVAIRKLKQSDDALATVINAVGGFALKATFDQSPFQVLLRAIVYQQLSGKSAGAIHTRVCELFGSPGQMSPSAVAGIGDEDFRQAGLSRAKLVAVRDLAEKVLDGSVPPLDTLMQLPDNVIIDQLTEVRGIGQWTVEMMLIYRLGRPDVLPVTDLGIRQGYQLMLDLPELPRPSAVARHGERWRPYRSVAAWYLWRATDSVNWADLRDASD